MSAINMKFLLSEPKGNLFSGPFIFLSQLGPVHSFQKCFYLEIVFKGQKRVWIIIHQFLVIGFRFSVLFQFDYLFCHDALILPGNGRQYKSHLYNLI